MSEKINERIEAAAIRQIAEWLHCAGLNAFTLPASNSQGDWDDFRMSLAKYIHDRLVETDNADSN